MEEFNIIIAGGRDFNDYGLLKEKVDKIISDKIKTHKISIISGQADGADKLGERYASENKLRIMKFNTDWGVYGKEAWKNTNVNMANYADALIAFWDGKSSGTKHMIEVARGKNIPTRIINY